jgi:hypothetical protein
VKTEEKILASVGIGAMVLGGGYMLLKGSATGKKVKATIASGPNGTTVPAPGVYDALANTQYFVYAVANSGYKFDHWTGDVPAGQEHSTPIQVNVQKNFSVKANFVVLTTPAKYTILFRATNGGSISPEGSYSYDQNSLVTVIARPDNGYQFMGWSGDWTGSNNPESVQVIRNNMTVIANFAPVQQQGVQLQAGWNYGITYGGTPGSPWQVCASVLAYLEPQQGSTNKPIWDYNPNRSPQWQYWYPNDPSSDLVQINQGDQIGIYVTQACFWTWI